MQKVTMDSVRVLQRRVGRAFKVVTRGMGGIKDPQVLNNKSLFFLLSHNNLQVDHRQILFRGSLSNLKSNSDLLRHIHRSIFSLLFYTTTFTSSVITIFKTLITVAMAAGLAMAAPITSIAADQSPASPLIERQS